jgi:hypothetical protein
MAILERRVFIDRDSLFRVFIKPDCGGKFPVWGTLYANVTFDANRSP